MADVGENAKVDGLASSAQLGRETLGGLDGNDPVRVALDEHDRRADRLAAGFVRREDRLPGLDLPRWLTQERQAERERRRNRSQDLIAAVQAVLGRSVQRAGERPE